MASTPDDRVAVTEQFELLGRIGHGGMGTVWRARDTGTGGIVALKTLHPHLADDPGYVARFEHEVAMGMRVTSPNVVRVLGYGVRESIPFMVMELAEGESLKERIARGPLSWEALEPIARDLARGLAAIHRAGIVHRDIKPSNVLLTAEGAKLADFGIARATDLTALTGTGGIVGTPAYMAPDATATPASDLYSLGIVLYEALTGAPPFAGRTTQEVLIAHIRETPDLRPLPAAARALIGTLLDRRPEARHTALRTLLAERNTAGPRRAARARPGGWLWLGAGAMIALLLGAAAALAALRSEREVRANSGDDSTPSPTAPPPTAVPETPIAPGMYTVLPGDSCDAISRRSGVSEADLMAANYSLLYNACHAAAWDEILVPEVTRLAVTVDARTGAKLSERFFGNELVRVTPHGEWCVGDQAANERVCYGAGGDPPAAWDTDLLVPGVNIASLVGRFGGGPWRAIGSGAALVAQGGDLELRMNDRVPYYDDNRGSLAVEVTIYRGANLNMPDPPTLLPPERRLVAVKETVGRVPSGSNGLELTIAGDVMFTPASVEIPFTVVSVCRGGSELPGWDPDVGHPDIFVTTWDGRGIPISGGTGFALETARNIPCGAVSRGSWLFTLPGGLTPLQLSYAGAWSWAIPSWEAGAFRPLAIP